MSNSNNFTPLVGVKWTKQRMLRVHYMVWNNYIEQMLNTVGFSNKEKIKRIQEGFYWYNHVIKLCNNNDIAFKKKEKNNNKK